MLGFPLGILSAAGAGGGAVAGDYELISTEILAGTQSSIVFSNLGDYASTYKHLQIRAVAKTNRSPNAGDLFGLRLNGDTGTNYSSHYLFGNGSSVASAADINISAMYLPYIAATGATASAFTGMVIDLLDTYAAKNKTIRFTLGNSPAVDGFGINVGSGAWRNTASLTSITFASIVGGSFIAGSRFSLYGIKG